MAKQKTRAKKDESEITDVIEKTLYKTVIVKIEKIGIAVISKNYVVFEEKIVNKEIVHATLGYFGDRSLSAALEEVSATVLKNRLTRKCRTEVLELEELRRIIDSHNRKFDKLLDGILGD